MGNKIKNPPHDFGEAEFRVLNLGAGVQSSALLLMSDRGDLPRLDLAIFADTGWEPKKVYDQLEWLEHEVSIEIVRVSAGNIRADALRSQVRGTKAKGQRWASMPMFTLNHKGSQGMIKRQCTREYKIDPIDKYLRSEILGLKPRQRAPKDLVIDQWFGITVDEFYRIKTSREPWKRFCYPFANIPGRYLSHDWTRSDCIEWLREKYPGREFSRSACIGCPFRQNKEWRALAAEELEDAIDFDNKIRDCGGMRGKLYIHSERRPLSEVDLRTQDEAGQGDMFNQECEGMCGI